MHLQIIEIFRLAIGNNSNPKSESQMERVKIFFHERGKFNFFMEQDTMANIMKIEPKMLDWQSATTFSITKSKFKSLNRDDRECEGETEYIWNDCLDEMFYLRKGFSLIRCGFPDSICFRIPRSLECQSTCSLVN